MNGTVDGQGANAGFRVGRIAATSHENRADRDVERFLAGEAARQPHAALGDVGAPRMRASRGESEDTEGSCSAGRPPAADLRSRRHSPCRPRPIAEAGACIGGVNSSNIRDFLHDLAGLHGREGLEIGQEVVRPREVGFGLAVEAAVNGVVGSLEQAGLAIDRELEGLGRDAGGGACPTRPAGTTTEAEMSSPIWTFRPR